MVYTKKGYSNEARQRMSLGGKKAAETKRSPELKKARSERHIILEAYESGEPVKNIAAKYQINKRAVYRIINGN